MKINSILLIAALTAAASVEAQRVEILPFGGIYRPIQQFPPVREGDDRFGSGLGKSGAVGLAVETRIAGPLGARATLLRAWPDLLVFDGPEPRSAPARVTVIAADLVVSGPRILVARPYLLLGTGTKRYSFAAAELGGAAAAEYAADRSESVGHIGAGILARFGRVGASVEVSNYTNGYRAATEPAPGDLPGMSYSRQNDLVYSFGLRFRAF